MKYFLFIVFTSLLSLNISANDLIECKQRKGRWDYPTSPLAKKISNIVGKKTCNGKDFKDYVNRNYPHLKILTTGKSEDSYNEKFCKLQGGITELKRIDCVTNVYAIEVDRAKKWREAIGQSLQYAYLSKKKPGIALITSKSQKDREYLKLLKEVIKYSNLDIKVWIIQK
ncbi:hypothetical protein M902_0698 [Bacteriovorax sp. BAL6_X]|uniref:hypothetical protein n=1 Tax=Bacteriovorax sp. BAL6_X TaxID=1201290 RepID=UPI0003865204|nr:hypothetical protein [Bacteriovorax sp. BAL6_X]EPZ49323.1 hypothetical protein M902_0698 [Bacteriovorax sp. BAL6_X]